MRSSAPLANAAAGISLPRGWPGDVGEHAFDVRDAAGREIGRQVRGRGVAHAAIRAGRDLGVRECPPSARCNMNPISCGIRPPALEHHAADPPALRHHRPRAARRRRARRLPGRRDGGPGRPPASSPTGWPASRSARSTRRSSRATSRGDRIAQAARVLEHGVAAGRLARRAGLHGRASSSRWTTGGARSGTAGTPGAR